MAKTDRGIFIEKLNATFDTLKEITPDDAEALDSAKASIIDALGGGDLEDYFDTMAHGAYKICYHMTSKWVLKAGTFSSFTQKEIDSYVAANNAGLDDIFVKTFWVTGGLFSADLMYEWGEWDQEYYDEETCQYVMGDREQFDYIMIQERIDYIACKLDEEYVLEEANSEEIAAYKRHLEVNGPKYYMNRPIFLTDKITMPSCDIWADRVEELYGREYQKKYYRFEESWGIGDLHSGNVGFKRVDNNPYHDRPVIIDWYSQGYWKDADVKDEFGTASVNMK